ncbi:MAG: M23 family metallopeptidase [Leptospiraceae bacterium]|nr:M23 family metallopeptidase [Leptospiraceae bacterium]
MEPNAEGNLAPPLKPPLILTGTTGEYRRSHFHYGIDLATIGGSQPVYSVQDGFVSRLLYDGTGLGYGIWVTHGDGRRSKYGHLASFDSSIVDALKDIHPELSEWIRLRKHFDLHLKAGQVVVRRSQKIAMSGDTGSGPAHLHFEYLDGDRILNPLLYGLTVEDRRAPIIEKIVLLPCESGSRINGQTAPVVLPARALDCPDRDADCPKRNFSVSNVTIRGKACMQVQYFDPSGKSARLGIERLRLFQDERELYVSSFKSLQYHSAFRHLVFYSESSRISRGTVYIQNVFDLLPGDFEFQRSTDRGRISASEDSRISVVLQDAIGNTSILRMQISSEKPQLSLVSHLRSISQGWSPYELSERMSDALDKSAGLAGPGKTLELSSDDNRFHVTVGPQALTGDVRFMLNESGNATNTGLKAVSPVYSLSGRNTDEMTGSIFRDRIFLISAIRLDYDVPEEYASKAALYRITGKGVYPVAIARNGRITGYVRSLERYVVLLDESAPRILNIPLLRGKAGKDVLLPLRYFREYGTGLDFYSLKLVVDGKPARAEWDPDRYGFEIYYPSEILSPGRHSATVQIKDNAGNESAVRKFDFIVD